MFANLGTFPSPTLILSATTLTNPKHIIIIIIIIIIATNIVRNQYHQDYLFCMAIGNSDGKLSSISRFKIPSITVDIVGYCNGLVCVAESYGPPIFVESLH